MGSEAKLGVNHADTLGCMYNLGALLQAAGRLKEAERLFRQELTGCISAHGSQHENTLGSLRNLAQLLQSQGRYDEAESLFKQELAGWESMHGPDHEDVRRSWANLEKLQVERQSAASRFGGGVSLECL